MSKKNISFATFNLLNLQKPGKAIYNNAKGWSEDAYEGKIAWSSDRLRRLEADVIGFQELWAKDALAQLLDRSGMGETYTALVPKDHDDRRIVCAGAVRSDILLGEPEWIVDFPEELVLQSKGDDPQQDFIKVALSKFSRPVLHFKVQMTQDVPVIHVFVCHFKSRRPAQVWRERAWYNADIHKPHATAIGYAISTVRRTAEAAALRVLITKITKETETPVVVLGDMNDNKLSNTLNILTEQPNYLTTLSAGGGDNALYTAQTLQELQSTRDIYYTYVYKRQHESLDHILFSEQFYDNSRKRLWAFDEMIVANDHLNFDDHKESGTTDHGIIHVTFKWKPAPGALS